MISTKDFMNDMSHEELVSYVYSTFPEEMDGAPGPLLLYHTSEPTRRY